MNKKNELIYYLFDWDDNILNMTTNIKLEHLINGVWVTETLDSEDFVKLRHLVKDYNEGKESEWRYVNNNPEITYSEFRDSGVRGDNAFIEDTINAINKKDFGPVWYDFIECLINGYLFAIVTARGHEPQSIQKTIKWIIFNYLTSEQLNRMIDNLKKFNILFSVYVKDLTNEELITRYLNNCDFAGISSKWFAERYNTIEARGTTSPEKYKIMVVKDFITKINGYGKKINRKIKIGFSDDDITNIQTMRDYFKYKLSEDFPDIEFHTYHTFKDGKYEIG